MLTRSQIKAGNVVSNAWMHPGRRHRFEVLDLTPSGFALYDMDAATVGTDTLAHPGWFVVQQAPMRGDAGPVTGQGPTVQ